MSDIKLGNLITTPQHRDAIHIAIAPVTSDETILPGQHLALVEGTTDRVRIASPDSLRIPSPCIGIADPFLPSAVPPGKPFWLCLYPQTITSLRHEWTHPAFAGGDDATQSLTALAERFGCSLERLLSRLDAYAEGSCGPDDDIQEGLNRLEEESTVRDMRANYERVRGGKVDPQIKSDTYFRCAC